MRFLSLGVFSSIVATVTGISMDNDDGINLLQTAKIHYHKHHHSHNVSQSQSPGARERQMCPHEIEEMQRNKVHFGCRDTLVSASTPGQCSWWGEPHVSATFASGQLGLAGEEGDKGGWRPDEYIFDVFYKPGQFKVAAAKDGSWEIQTFNCGRYATALAARLGKDIVEFVSTYSGIKRYLNGKEVGNVDNENGLYMSGRHRRVRNNNNEMPGEGRDQTSSGACVDDPGGQVYFEVGADSTHNLNAIIWAASGSYTTLAEDPNSLCNHVLTPHQWKWTNWDLERVKPEDSLFTLGREVCALCDQASWWHAADGFGETRLQAICDAKTPTEYDVVSLQQTCKEKGIDLQAAKDACVHLQDSKEFFKDCQLDFCASGGNPEAVADAEDELHQEHPEPVCVHEGVGCDPAKVCCDAKKDRKIWNLENVATNNLCGDGVGPQELRFTSVLLGVDLVVKATGEYKCKQGVNNAKNGVNGKFGAITIPVGTEVEFDFTFVTTGTDNPKVVGAQPVSFLDLDQGKKSKQRESVEVCGASNAIVTSNTELEKSTSGDCIKVTSTTPGDGKDNPSDPDDLGSIQRARTVAFTVAGSSFKVTLGVSAKGHHARKFFFSGSPSIACDAL